MLEQEYKTMYNNALKIPNWRKANKNDLANAYIDNEKNEDLRNAYFSALMLRYWGNIGKYYTSSKSSGFTIEDCYSWLIEALLYALDKRKWRDPNNPLSKDKNAPDKVINRCIYSRRKYYYYLSNLDKRKSNHNKISIEDNDDVKEDYNILFSTEDNGYKMLDNDILTISCNMYKSNRWYEIFLLNFLYLNDYSKFNKKSNTWEFNIQRIVEDISNLEYKEFEFIMRQIHVKSEDIPGYYNEIKDLKDNKIKNLLNKTLKSLKTNKELKELKELCY